MRIISKEKDYYDTASVYGIDKETIYNRESKVIEKSKNNYRSYDGFEMKRKFYKIEFCVIGFCGSFHPCIKSSYEYVENGNTKIETKVFYDLKAYENFFTTEIYNERRVYFSLDRVSYSNKKSLINFFENSYQHLNSVFREHMTPVFVFYMKSGKRVINPILKNYEFYKVKEPTVAFQDIYSYLSGVLGSIEKDITTISDKDKIQQRGFDPVYGFRKKPSKK